MACSSSGPVYIHRIPGPLTPSGGSGEGLPLGWEAALFPPVKQSDYSAELVGGWGDWLGEGAAGCSWTRTRSGTAEIVFIHTAAPAAPSPPGPGPAGRPTERPPQAGPRTPQLGPRSRVFALLPAESDRGA
ncbi:hypothetical protein HJG60_011782 [Phyllostomus discolor]|uniref:Uncharacterized protein n=1 Tax=Phyllostomus discolor TaxID=89673 RepID=A0A834DYB7_9CHIR|nr:hypothetical protein HJG60_011782 [Phyllostomus discolor]